MREGCLEGHSMALMYAYNLDTLFTCFLDIISIFPEGLTAYV